MTLLSKIKDYYFKKELTKQISQSIVKRRAHSDTKTIGIIFDASLPENREIIAMQAENLRGKGKKVRILGFFNDKMPHEGTPYPYFNLKDLDWRLIPKKEAAVIADFAKQPFDLLYTYVIGENKIIDFITATSQANFKAGRFTELHAEAHLSIDTQSNTDLKFLIRQIDFYLAKVNKKYEVAVAV
jgi:hypothetical protein